MYEWLSNFELFKVPKTLITKILNTIKLNVKLKG